MYSFCFHRYLYMKKTLKIGSDRGSSHESLLFQIAFRLYSFSQTRRNWQKCHRHQRLYTMTTKNSDNKNLPLVRIEPGTPDSKSNILISELTWHLLPKL